MTATGLAETAELIIQQQNTCRKDTKGNLDHELPDDSQPRK